MFADLDRSLSKSPLMNGRGRTHSEPIGGGRAPKSKPSDVITLSNRDGADGFSKRKREREPRRMMMTGNKRGVEPYAGDDDWEQRSLDDV